MSMNENAERLPTPIPVSRREFLKTAAASTAGLALSSSWTGAQVPGERPPPADKVDVLNPRTRGPVSLIIDDSTCLVNLAHFAIPQFAQVFPDRYRQPWRDLPREIPDSFVRRFAEWCRENGVKGKYSVVPFPACVGWVDRELPGWSRRELQESLKLVRDFLMPDWDIHPEMVTHTWVIDPRTGRPFPEKTAAYMENWRWTDDRSVDELAGYMGYALRMLRNVDLPCEGITTPGGFGNRVLPELAQATLQACREVFGAEIPHYFRHLYTDDRSVAPRVEYASGLDRADPECVVSIIGCTGDWFGGWDGLSAGSVDRFITADLQGGRLPEVIAREEPAIMVCHWPGIYFNGEETGFRIFQEVVRRLQRRYDHLLWMKLSEIARYGAARELTRIRLEGEQVELVAPFECPDYTIRLPVQHDRVPELVQGEKIQRLTEVSHPLRLTASTWCRGEGTLTACFRLPKGRSRIRLKRA